MKMHFAIGRQAAVIAAVGLLSGGASCGEPQAPTMRDSEVKKLEVAADKLRPLFTPNPQTDWIQRRPDELRQTFEQYRQSRPNRPTPKRTTLYLQPLGDFSPPQERAVKATADYLERFYGVSVKMQPRLGLEIIPQSARRVHPDWGNKQILSTYVLDKVLKPRRPDDAVAVLALTTSDLWPGEGWNFVFGQASLVDRVGVWSLDRYGDAEKEYPTFLRRTLKVAVHETGHMLGVPHCIAYRCGMNGSNNRSEMDATPLAFCPECAQKIWWSCNLQPASWYRSLVEFAEREKLEDEAAFWRASLEVLSAEGN